MTHPAAAPGPARAGRNRDGVTPTVNRGRPRTGARWANPTVPGATGGRTGGKPRGCGAGVGVGKHGEKGGAGDTHATAAPSHRGTDRVGRPRCARVPNCPAAGVAAGPAQGVEGGRKGGGVGGCHVLATPGGSRRGVPLRLSIYRALFPAGSRCPVPGARRGPASLFVPISPGGARGAPRDRPSPAPDVSPGALALLSRLPRRSPGRPAGPRRWAWPRLPGAEAPPLLYAKDGGRGRHLQPIGARRGEVTAQAPPI